MVNIEFDFNKEITIIQGNLDEPFKIAVDKYTQKNSINPTSVYFLANGKKLNLEQTIESQMTEINKKNNKLSVLVTLIINDNNYNQKICNPIKFKRKKFLDLYTEPTLIGV